MELNMLPNEKMIPYKDIMLWYNKELPPGIMSDMLEEISLPPRRTGLTRRMEYRRKGILFDVIVSCCQERSKRKFLWRYFRRLKRHLKQHNFRPPICTAKERAIDLLLSIETHTTV